MTRDHAENGPRAGPTTPLERAGQPGYLGELDGTDPCRTAGQSNCPATEASGGITLVAAVLATAFGIMASLGLLALRGRALSLALAVLLLPLVVPYICLAVGLLILVQEVSAQPTLVAVVLGHSVIALPSRSL